jgi:hypothetical protein
MTFQMDTSGDEDYSKVGAGFKRLPPGRFHCEIIEVDESFQKHAQKVVVVFEVLNGTVPDQAGRRHSEFFSISENAMDRLKRLAMVTGLIAPGEQKEVSFNDCVGAALVIEIVPNSYEKDGKKIETTQIDFGGLWAEDHEDVKEVPRGKKSDRPSGEGGGSSGGSDAWSNV